MALTTVNSSGIKDDSIVNADIKSDAAIALSKLASTPAVLTGSTNNTVCTVTSANNIQGESNVQIDSSGRLLLGAGSISLPKGSAAGSFDLDNGNITMCIGGNSNSTGRTNSTDKVNRITSPHYTNTEEPVALLSSFNQSGNSTISYGGGSSQTNAVTQHAFYTAANTTTTNGIERMRIDSSGRLGIGTDSPTRYLHVKETAGGNAQIIVETTANAERAQIEFKSPHGTWVTGTYGGNTTGDWLTYTAGAKNAVFHQNGSEKLRIQSGGGISFNGDSAAANALDDYEEGTWTPTIYSSSAGNFNYPTNGQLGIYTKVGNIVHVNGFVQATVTGTETGQVRMGSLPFTASNTNANFAQVLINDYGNFDSYDGHVGGYVHPGQTNVILIFSKEGDSSGISTSKWGTNTYMYFSLTYRVA